MVVISLVNELVNRYLCLYKYKNLPGCEIVQLHSKFPSDVGEHSIEEAGTFDQLYCYTCFNK